MCFSDQNNCIRGFPDIPVSEVSHRTRNDNIILTLLVPEMNFTSDATIIGVTVAGRNLSRNPRSQIQIWRRNSSQNSDIEFYHQVEHSVPIQVPNRVFGAGGVCMAAQRIAGDTFWCILKDNLQVPVQAGDIFGLELPRTRAIEIFFTQGGPVNHIFEGQPGTTVNLSNNASFSKAQQLPQIMLNLTSGTIYYCIF